MFWKSIAMFRVAGFFSRFSLAFSVFLVNFQRNLSEYSKHDWKYFKHTWYESMQMNYFPHLLLRFTLIHCVTHFLATFQCNAKITAKKKPQKPQLFTVSTQSTTLYNRIIHRWVQSDFSHTTVTLVALSYQRDFIWPIVWIVVSWLFIIPFFCFCFI